jgi:SAM-dependent methyltransferase
MTRDGALLHQLAYYRARAGEYDDWWWRTGRYDRGPNANARWFGEIETLEHALDRFAPTGAVLELACGTGLWTRHLVRTAETVTAVDGAPEVLALNRDRIEHLRQEPSERSLAPVQYVEAELFGWEPRAAAFDACVFAFWLSHVPDDRFAAFWASVARALRPGGRVFVIDSARSERSKARDHVMPDSSSSVERRRLDDGREFEVVKRYYEGDELTAQLAALGWACDAESTGEFFIYATAVRGSAISRRR